MRNSTVQCVPESRVRRRLVGALLATGATSSPLAWGKLAASGGSKWVVGQTLPLTGAFSEVGLAYGAGSKLYFDQFNKVNTGGVQVELRQVDDAHQPVRANLNMRKLLEGGADVLFGCVGTAISELAADMALQSQTLLFAPLAAPDVLRDAKHEAVFHTQPAMGDEAMRMLQHCAVLGHSRISVIAQDDSLGNAGVAAVLGAATALRFKAPAVQIVPVGSGLSPAQAASIMADQAQAVVQASQFGSSAAGVKSLRSAGYRGQFFNFSFVGIGPLYTALGKDIRGVVVAQGLPAPTSGAKLIAREYIAAIEQTDQSASYESLGGYIAAKALCNALLQLPKLGTVAALQKQLTKTPMSDIGGLSINLRAPLGGTLRGIELVTLTAEGAVLR